jgi:tetrahydromethanopterin S-methyltransferase subunit F
MWDILITIGNLLALPALVPTVIDRNAYVPRLTSGLTIAGLTIAVIGMFGSGLLFGPLALAGIDVMWVAIFVLRGTERVPGHSHVAIGAPAHDEAAPEAAD